MHALTKKVLFHVFIITVIGLLTYANVFNAPFVFDDINFIVEKAGSSTFNLSQSRLVGFLSFALNYKLHGLTVAGYHIVNISVHIINSLLVYFLVALTFKTPFLKVRTPSSIVHAFVTPQSSTVNYEQSAPLIALFSALLFVSHPLQTEAVTYIWQRVTCLATLFCLLSLVSYIKSRISELPATRYTLYAVSLLSAVLAMKTKEIAFTLPVVIALYEFMFFDGKIKKRLLYLIPLFLTMAIIPLTFIGTDKPVGDLVSDVHEVTRVQTPLARPDYLFTQFRVIVTYVRLLFLPIKQNLDYDYPVYHSFSDPNVFLSFLFLLSIFAFGIFLFFRSRVTHHGVGSNDTRYTLHATRCPLHAARLIAFGIFWFFITLSVESSVIPIVDVIFEHRVYLPSIGVFIAAATAVFTLSGKRSGMSRHVSKKTVLAFSLLIMALSVAAFGRNATWKDEIVLWHDVVSKSPHKARGYNNLGVAYADKGEPDKAIEYFELSVSTDPYHYDAYVNRGIYYQKKGDTDRAIEDLNRALFMDSNSYKLYNARGLIYGTKGEYDKAVKDFTRSLSINPYFQEAYNNRGVSYEKMGQYEKAINDYNRAISINPNYAEAHFNLGNAYYKNASFDRAIAEYTLTIGANPSFADAYNNRGFVYYKQGNYDRAIADCNKAVALKPDFAEALDTRGVIYASMGKHEKAIEDFSRAISLIPNSSESYVNRGNSYLKSGKRRNAFDDFKKACEMGNKDGCRRKDFAF